MKKNTSKILLIIGSVILIVGLIFVIQEKFQSPEPQMPSQDDTGENPNKPGGSGQIGGDIEDIQTEEKTQEELNELVDVLFSSDVSKEKLEKLVGSNIPSEYVYYGKDAYLRNIGSDFKDVEAYHKKRNEYAKQLENYIKDNFAFEILEYIVSDDGAIVQTSTYRTYYYVSFIKDLQSLTSELYKYSDLDMEELVMREPTSAEQVKMYKLRIKALEIMSNYFENYVNDEETVEYTLIYRKENGKLRNDYYSLLINFAGEMYKNEKISDTNRNVRINSYISEAISSGQLDTSNPYKLK